MENLARYVDKEEKTEIKLIIRAYVLERISQVANTTQDKTKLQFPQERRKIECAHKFFNALHLDYRHITANTPAWWLPDDVQQPYLEV